MNLTTWAVVGAIFTMVVGTVMHYIYDWSNGNKFIAIFGSVNESVWEHLKLIFWPMFFFMIAEYFKYGNNLPNFIPIRAFSILLGMVIIVIIFYTHTGIIGKNSFIVNIATFILAVSVAYFFSHQAMSTDIFSQGIYQVSGWILLILLISCFAIFTFAPPKLNIFRDPLSGKYGI